METARQLVAFWDMQPEELAGPVPARPAAPVAATVKYEHPVTGDVWDGEGEHPEWLRRALLTEGYRTVELKPGSEEFLALRQRAQSA